MSRPPSRSTSPLARTLGTLLAVTLALGVAACSQESTSPTTSDEMELSPPTETSTTVTTASSTTAAPTTTEAPTTTTTEPVDVTTSEPEVTTTDVEPTPTTTEPEVIRELVLRSGGLGSVTFGAEPDGVIEYLGSFLGAPTTDTGWVDPDEFALCPGDEVRRVEWGVLRLSFGDVSTFANERRHVYAWQYGRPGELGEEPQGLRTDRGVGLGTSVADLVAAYPDVALYEGDEELFPPGFELDDDFFGFLTGLGDDDVVTEIFSGYFCGE